MDRESVTDHEGFVGRVLRLKNSSPNRQPFDLYRLSKEIDGRPEATGSFPLFASRVVMLGHLARWNPSFYEPLGSYDDLLVAARINGLLIEGGAPGWAANALSVSVRLFESAYGAPCGRLPLPAPGEREQGVHQVGVDGRWTEGGEALRFRNSWGGEWGDRGMGELTRAYAETHMVEAWLARSAAVGPTRAKFPRLLGATDARRFAEVWMTENRVLRMDPVSGAAGRDVYLYETLSIRGAPVEVVDLRDVRGLPVGWAHLHHVPHEQLKISVLKELFVWPGVRRRGHGRLLEGVARDRAGCWGSKKLRILFHEADDFVGNRAAAKAFARTARYDWRWASLLRPNVSAVCEKTL